MSIVNLIFEIIRVHPLIMVNKSVKFDEEAHNSLVSIVFKMSKCDTHGQRHGTTAVLLYHFINM